ncbi:hypothetical protein ACSU1N_05805 [Thermogladius sp. 4427co]|uniref:hypothetical protein n=1 Tax=Thermogladius sp. 4427co TaxID=3450718 RepID=UPI003F7963BE
MPELLTIREGFLKITVVDPDGEIDPLELISKLNRLSVKRKSLLIELYYITKLEHVEFFEKYRDILLNNIHLTIYLKRIHAVNCEDAVKSLDRIFNSGEAPVIIVKMNSECYETIRGRGLEIEVV